MKLQIQRGGQERVVEVVRGDRPSVRGGPSMTVFPDGVVYVDLSRVDMPALDAAMAKLAAAPGIVFDMRQRPLDDVPVLSHLLSQVDTAKGFAIAHIVRPDHTAASFPRWDVEGWNLPVLQPHLAGRSRSSRMRLRSAFQNRS